MDPTLKHKQLYCLKIAEIHGWKISDIGIGLLLEPPPQDGAAKYQRGGRALISEDEKTELEVLVAETVIIL
jgi:hypothetical protein